MTPSRRKLVIAGAGASALTLGAVAATVVGFGILPFPGLLRSPQSVPQLADTSGQPSEVLPLVNLKAEEREATLQAIAQRPPSVDQAHAKFLLAADLITQNRGGAAIPLLDGLEKDYPVLAPVILARRAQAQTATGDNAAATATWQTLVKDYPDSPMTVEALEVLGKTNPQYWQEAIARFPAHPRTVQLVLNQLAQNPNQPQLLLHLARYGVDLPDITGVLDRLVAEYNAQLTPEDWEAIAFAYWENMRYNSAGKAYAKAPATAVNMYRAGRGAHLGDRRADALTYYQKTIDTFPEAPETATALLRMADLARPVEQGLPYLEQVIQRFPNRAGDALLKKARLLDALNSPDAATQTRDTLLTQFSSSEAAGELRWELAEGRMKAGDMAAAQTWAQQLVEQNPTSDYAPEAAYWLGKWARQRGDEAAAKVSFERVLQRYPESYYAWRSAVMLGWEVGDFTTVRYLQPEVRPLDHRPVPPAGSETLKELYRLGQDREAYAYWQTEFKNPKAPTVEEQFTDGLMRLGVQDNLNGIFMVSSLRNREDPQEQAEYQALKQQPAYWEALYPFPFVDLIETWSQQRQLNPLLVTALIRQESRFEPKIESVAGALGLMQVMPSTGEWIATQLGLTAYRLDDPNDNVNLGTWYLDYTHDTYNEHSLLAVASYNAGPGAVAGWLERFSLDDPDLFVEQIPYPETKGYVESVFANYWNYLRLYNPAIAQKLADLQKAEG